MKVSWFTLLLLVAALYLGSVQQISAQPQLPPPPVQVDKAPKVNHAIPLVIAIVLTIGVAIGSAMSSKRGHQD